MSALPAESVDAIVTSPPYAMQRKSTYGGIHEADYPAWTVAWMTEARRILKPDGSVIINISPHKSGGQLADYVMRTRLAIRADGWAELDEIIWHKTDAMPTGSPSRPRRAWESLLWYGKHGRAYGNPKANGGPPVRTDSKWTSRSSRNGWGHDISGGMTAPATTRAPNVVSMGKAKAASVDHPAMYPVQLAEWCGKLITPPGGTILDPFNGSASTGVAALRNGWNYIGIDAVPEYIEMSARRLDYEAEKGAAWIGTNSSNTSETHAPNMNPGSHGQTSHTETHSTDTHTHETASNT